VDSVAVSAPGAAAVEASRTEIIVTSVRIADSRGDGVVVGAGAVAEVVSTSVSGAAGAGVVTRDGGVCEQVAHCVVDAAGGDGVRVTSAHVTDNVVTNSGGAGISLYGDVGAALNAKNRTPISNYVAEGIARNRVDGTGAGRRVDGRRSV